MIETILGNFLYFLTNLLYSTLRIELINKSFIDHASSSNKKVIFALWHHQTLVAFHIYRNKKACLLTASSLRGKTLAYFAKKMGYQTFPIGQALNSSESARATINYIKELKKGFDGVIALDGPKGPALKAKPGIFYIASKTGNSIYPIGSYYSQKIQLFWRWDKYEIPLPFCKVILVSGNPIDICNYKTINENFLCAQIEEEINKLNREAKKFGEK